MITTIENPAIQKLISNLASEGITFAPDDERVPVWGFYGGLIGARFLDNVVFTKGAQQIKLANRIFYRESGLSTILGTNKDGTVKTVTVTDIMFYQMIKESVSFRLNPPN